MNKPKIVCLCGSTRFSEAYREANLRETLAGNVVLTIGCDMRSDGDLFAAKTPEEREQIKARLDDLHLRKIDMADEVVILNVGGYVGESTRREIQYAQQHGKVIRWLELPDDLYTRFMALQKAVASYMGIHLNKHWERTELQLGDEEIEMGQIRTERDLRDAMRQLGWCIEADEDGYTDIRNEALNLHFRGRQLSPLRKR